MVLSRSDLRKFGRMLRSRRAGLAAFALLLIVIFYKVFSGQASFPGGPVDSGAFSELGPARLPHYTLLTFSLWKSIWPLSLLGVILIALTFRVGRVISDARQRCTTETVDQQSGSSAVEFVMVLPLLTVMLLMILQIALVVQAKFVVNYAAFCAARSAIVIIPDELGGSEARNNLANPDRSEKFEIIQHAAALPLTAISPLPGWRPAIGSPVLSNLGDASHLLLLLPFSVGSPPAVEQVILRGPYAYDKQNTILNVSTIQGAESGAFKEHDFVTVKVTYRYYLAVPFAKKLFGTAYSGNPFVNIIFGTDYYYPIVEQYTLPMDGEPIT